MKEIVINSKKHGQKVALVDDSDYEWLNQYRWVIKKSCNVYYAQRNVISHKKTQFMHRLILGLTDFNIKCDHRDRNGLNNQRSNLRTATNSQNLANRAGRKNSTSKYLGVSWHTKRRKWIAQMRKDGVSIYIGEYKNEKEAASAYNKKALELHKEFAFLNDLNL